ncbi:hypothetical protein BK411_06905 [Vibrio splendidus]|nr:hypothetical protein BK411_06905 [Vibrio splendidus]
MCKHQPFLVPVITNLQKQKRLPTGAFQIVFFNQIALVQGKNAEFSALFPKTKRDSMSPFKSNFQSSRLKF